MIEWILRAVGYVIGSVLGVVAVAGAVLVVSPLILFCVLVAAIDGFVRLCGWPGIPHEG